MAIGKKEQIIIVSIGALAAIGAVHFFIFQTKAKDYKSVNDKYNESVQKLETAEFISDANRKQYETFKADTIKYQALETSVAQTLAIKPLDLSTSASVASVDSWASRTLELLKQISDLRMQRIPQLSFLDQKYENVFEKSANGTSGRNSRGRGATAQQGQYVRVSAGWDLPRALPAQVTAAQLRDVSLNLIQYHRFIQSTNNIIQKLDSRRNYNLSLMQLGIDPMEVSSFFVPYGNQNVFFNDEKWFDELARNNSSYQQLSQPAQRSSYHNPLGLYKMGPAIPALKKLYYYALIKERINNPEFLTALGDALELNIPLDTNALDVTNKQLETLLYVIQLAGKHQVTEITKVNFLRPTNFDKAVNRVPGVVPTPDTSQPAAATPAAMMDPMMMDPMMMDPMMMGGMGGMGAVPAGPTPIPDEQRIAAGSGVEIYFRAPNTNGVRFLYDLTHGTKTYSLDDLNINAVSADGMLSTSATVELVTEIGAKAGTGAAPTTPEAGAQ